MLELKGFGDAEINSMFGFSALTDLDKLDEKIGDTLIASKTT